VFPDGRFAQYGVNPMHELLYIFEPQATHTSLGNLFSSKEQIYQQTFGLIFFIQYNQVPASREVAPLNKRFR